MSQPSLLPALCLAAALAVLTAGCGEDPAPAVPSGPGAGSPAVAAGTETGERDTVSPIEMPEGWDFETAQELDRAQRKQGDEHARGLMASFKSRLYEPERDSRLRLATGVAIVRMDDGREGRLSIGYDASVEDVDARLTVKALEGVEALPEATTAQVRRFASIGLHGAYPYIAYYEPPVEYWLSLTNDRKREFVVTAPPFKTRLRVSYHLDERELVMNRGTILPNAANDADAGREISQFTYEDYQGRYLMKSQSTAGTDSRIEFDYEERDLVIVLKLARLEQGERLFTCEFVWDELRRDEP